MSRLPSALRAALDELAENRGRRDLAARSGSITEAYRARSNSSAALLSEDDALAYALARMPATFAAVGEALGRLAEAMPDFAPNSLLDAGCGPGTASFAAANLWPTIAEATMIDRNGPFLALARRLAPALGDSCAAAIESRDLAAPAPLPNADVAVAAYVLAELPDAAGTALVERLWRAADHALLLVEPGTPDGFERLRRARLQLIGLGAAIAAPCTHEAACPMAGDRWCRFFARVERSRDHKLLKGGDRPFEDEPYAYLAAVRGRPERRAGGRIVARPKETKAAIRLELCGPGGLQAMSTPSRDRASFKQHRKLRWGDAVAAAVQSEAGDS